MALGVSVADAFVEGMGGFVPVGVYNASGVDGCEGCGEHPANTTKIESLVSIEKMVFIKASIFYLWPSLACSDNGYVLWLEQEIPSEILYVSIITLSLVLRYLGRWRAIRADIGFWTEVEGLGYCVKQRLGFGDDCSRHHASRSRGVGRLY